MAGETVFVFIFSFVFRSVRGGTVRKMAVLRTENGIEAATFVVELAGFNSVSITTTFEARKAHSLEVVGSNPTRNQFLCGRISR